ncbi:MAG: hypothetical protein IPM60_00445 [Rhodospirillales bacterium]|nr:hypothetical protein [Rhodospirillales bacterium]
MIRQIFRGAAMFMLLAVPAGALWESSASAAEQVERPVVLSSTGVEKGEAFACRIPIDIEYQGSEPLEQMRVIAKVYDGEEELASTGLASGDEPLVRKAVEGGWIYSSVPLQFDLTAALCQRVDGLRVEFASCMFGEHPAEDCLDKIRFANAPKDDPLFLPLE